MNSYRHKNRGVSTWGAGIGLLSTVIVAALMLWMIAKYAQTYTSSPGGNIKAPIDRAKEVVGDLNERNANLSKQVDQEQSPPPAPAGAAPSPAGTTAPATAAPPAPAAPPPRPTDKLPPQMPAHDGGLLEEMSK